MKLSMKLLFSRELCVEFFVNNFLIIMFKNPKWLIFYWESKQAKTKTIFMEIFCRLWTSLCTKACWHWWRPSSTAWSTPTRTTASEAWPVPSCCWRSSTPTTGTKRTLQQAAYRAVQHQRSGLSPTLSFIIDTKCRNWHYMILLRFPVYYHGTYIEYLVPDQIWNLPSWLFGNTYKL